MPAPHSAVLAGAGRCLPSVTISGSVALVGGSGKLGTRGRACTWRSQHAREPVVCLLDRCLRRRRSRRRRHRPRLPAPGTRGTPSCCSFDLSNTPPLVGVRPAGDPWERMHRAKASAPFWVVVVAVVDRGEPPPQPAASSETTATATTEVGMSRREQRTRFGSFQSRAGNATSIPRRCPVGRPSGG